MSSSAPARPQVVDLAAQPYVFVRDTVPMTELSRIADRLPRVVRQLAEQGVGLGGAPFFRHLVIDMPDRLEVEVGVPVDSTDGIRLVDGLCAGQLPAGRYATALHHGHPAGLVAATGDLLAWADGEDLRWDRRLCGGLGEVSAPDSRGLRRCRGSGPSRPARASAAPDCPRR